MSLCFKKNLIEKNIFSNDEALYILEHSVRLQMRMRVPDLKFITLNNFEQI